MWLVFRNCSINGTEEYLKLYNNNPEVHKNYLIGEAMEEVLRPWKLLLPKKGGCLGVRILF